MADAMRKPARQGQEQEVEPLPGVCVGDELYVKHARGPTHGRVVCHGQHGATLDIGGAQHKVPWKFVLGHRKRAAQTYAVEDQGEDGMIVRDAAGGRHFIGIPPEAREDRLMVKASDGGLRLVTLKAMPPGPGLTQKKITDKNGVQTTRWVRIAPDHQLEAGHHVGFKNGEHAGHGRVAAVGKDGATVKDKAGGIHRVPHATLTHHWEGGGEPDHSPHEPPPAPKRPAVKPHVGDPDRFNAAAFAAEHNDHAITADSIIDEFGGDSRQRIDAARKRLGGVKQTIEEYAPGGTWDEKRLAMHQAILFDGVEVRGKKVPGLLSAERIKAATPAPGQQPVFIALGGRGGSGKSSLNGLVYDESKAIVLDADHIKGMLPEYEGWNAHQVHEESGHILEATLELAKRLGVNVVLDATMKSAGIAAKVDDFKSAGFRIEAHYMHLPRQDAARRAIGRFLNGGERGRFVPPEVVLGNVNNEANFDAIKDKADAWSFHDNSGAKGSGPTLIARKGDPATIGG